MAEGLALAASIIAVVQISGTVISLCNSYQSAVKKASKEILQLSDGVSSLKDVLDELAKLLLNKSLPKEPFEAIRSLLSSSKTLDECQADLAGLENKLKPQGNTYSCTDDWSNVS